MNQANDCGPCAGIVSRIDSTSGVFNWKKSNTERSTSNAQPPTFNLRSQLEIGRWALSVRRLAFSFGRKSFCPLETNQHIPQTAARRSLPAAPGFQPHGFYSRGDFCGGGGV